MKNYDNVQNTAGIFKKEFYDLICGDTSVGIPGLSLEHARDEMIKETDNKEWIEFIISIYDEYKESEVQEKIDSLKYELWQEIENVREGIKEKIKKEV
jgi:hypothetical protein